MTPFSLALVILAGINSCIGNILLKTGRLRLEPDAGLIAQTLSPWFIGGIFFYVINVFLFAKALDTAPVSVAYPILATSGFALLIIAANFIFGERLSPVQFAGLGLAVLGIFLMARGGS